MSFLDALNGSNSGPIPVWFMRQAGRYLPSYQELKKHHSLLELFKTPKLAHQVTCLPFQDLDLDAAIIFSDILVVFEALGFEIDYPIDKGPQIKAPCDVKQILESLELKNVASSLDYVFESIQLVKASLDKPLLGFSATPFTLLAYLLQKPMTEDIKAVKTALYTTPELCHRLLEILTDVITQYALLQIQSGIDAWQFFDTASTWLSDEAFNTFSLPYTEKILQVIHQKRVPTILFSKSSASRMPSYQGLNVSMLSVDWTANLKALRSQLPTHIGLQGNLDPFLTTLEFPFIESELVSVMQPMIDDPRFVFNLGHGVFPSTKLETLQKIISAIRALKPATLSV
jgi:uroporphyrinogen decarboxylase